MSDILAYLSNLRDLRNVLDIVLVALLIFVVLRLFQGTQAVQLIRGVLFIALIALVASQTLDLIAFNWILVALSPAILVALPVIFQPELRRALERIGRTAPFFNRRSDNALSQTLVNEIARAVEQMARRRTGALLVFEGLTGLGEIIDRGVKLNADISAELLQTIFFPNTPLHDGATIIRGEKIVAAGCVLPLAQADLGDSQMGTRHRAGIGITEQTDAMSVIVSEETGNMSVARNGRIVRVDGGTLRRILSEFYKPNGENNKEKKGSVEATPAVAVGAKSAVAQPEAAPVRSANGAANPDDAIADNAIADNAIADNATAEKAIANNAIDDNPGANDAIAVDVRTPEPAEEEVAAS